MCGKTIYINLKYTKSNSHFASTYRQLYMLITIRWLPSMEGESNRRGFRNRENERGRRESKDNNFNWKEKKITLMGYYNPSVVQFYSLGHLLGGCMVGGVNGDLLQRGYVTGCVTQVAASFLPRTLLFYIYAPHDFQSFRLWSFHQSLAPSEPHSLQ